MLLHSLHLYFGGVVEDFGLRLALLPLSEMLCVSDMVYGIAVGILQVDRNLNVQ